MLQGLHLRYQKTESSLWSFVLSAPDTNAYIAIGFSSDGSMVGSSAIVGWVGSNGGIKQYYLGGTQSSSVEPNKGSLQVLGNTSAALSQSQRIYMAFQLDTTQPQSKLLYAVGPQGQFPSSPEFRLSQHEYKISTRIDYLTGQATIPYLGLLSLFDQALAKSQSGTVQTPYSRLRMSHGVLNMLGWGVLMPIGIIVARYFKQFDPTWFYVHVSIQSGGFILGSVGVVCGLVLNDRINANVAKHKALGIVILVLGCLQVTAFLARPDKVSKVRKYWNWYHHGVGKVLIALAVVNVFYGIHLGNAGNGWNAGFGVVLASLLIVAIVAEFRKWARK
uniref:Cytochrome b561 and DOMON domain-containing protein n=1 Tax=Vitis vinifera TaxID=29760 RepID=F6I1X2_VITVI